VQEQHRLTLAGLGDVEVEAASGLKPMANAINLWHLVGHGGGVMLATERDRTLDLMSDAGRETVFASLVSAVFRQRYRLPSPWPAACPIS
jgi:hypothetical protein